MFLRILVMVLVLLTAAGPALAASFNPFNPELIPPAPVGRDKFLWGVALSGYQNDGSVASMDWYALEQSGKLPQTSAMGPDFRGNFEGDLDRAKSLGLNAFRTSIEWARIEPTEGHYDPAEIAYVHHLLKGIRKRGMTPLMTLHHFITPQWALKDAGDGLRGWESPRTVAAYIRYVEFVAKEFGSEIDYYITFNEPSTLISGAYLLGWTLPHRVGPVSTVRASLSIVNAHSGAYDALHRLDPGAQVTASDYNAFFPVADGGLYYMPNQIMGFLLDKTHGWDGRERVMKMDFIALQYYGMVEMGDLTFPVQPFNWGVSTSHFARILRAYYDAFHLPILVAENGFATRDLAARPDGWTRESYLVAHIQAIQEARAVGIPVMGYMYWTLTDNFEWGSYEPRFGLWSVDCAKGDLTRRETAAASVYRDIIKNGGVTPALARRFPPPDGPLEGPPVRSSGLALPRL